MKNIKFWLVSTTLWIQVWEQNVFTAHTSYSKFNCVYGLATWLENRGRHLSCCPCIYRSILVGPFCCESFLQSRPRHRFLFITFAILLRLTSNHLQTLAFDAFYRFAPSDSPNDQPEPTYPQKRVYAQGHNHWCHGEQRVATHGLGTLKGSLHGKWSPQTICLVTKKRNIRFGEFDWGHSRKFRKCM